ncbi:hypothetical protein, partial [Enterococcus hirae]|uniref:hypothetical protein n=1 Tax=Enterococcus hirae TaxID=1354 RepID=UPI0024335CA4
MKHEDISHKDISIIQLYDQVSYESIERTSISPMTISIINNENFLDKIFLCQQTKKESGTIVRKKSDYCPIFFLILRYTKSTQPCMIKVPKQKSKE